MITSTVCYSIGHSNHSWQRFIELIAGQKIKCIVDVRSFPRSRFVHFRRENLSARLSKIDVEYVFEGDDLGGLSPDGDPLNYARRANDPNFVAAAHRVMAKASAKPTAMLCSEHDPINCHRCLLIGRALAHAYACEVVHIERDGSLTTQGRVEAQLAKQARVGGLFDDYEVNLDRIYRTQAIRIGTE